LFGREIVGQKTTFFKNEPEKLLKTKDRQKKRTGEMAKRTQNEATDLVENAGGSKKRTGTNLKINPKSPSLFLALKSPAFGPVTRNPCHGIA
jgi:hypothetical protein